MKTTIKVHDKKTVKKVITAHRLQGSKVSNMQVVGEQTLIEIDYKHPNDLWEAGLMYPVAEPDHFDKADAEAAKKKAAKAA